MSEPERDVTIIRAGPAEMGVVFDLVESLLSELDDGESGKGSIDREAVSRAYHANGDAFTAFLARDTGGRYVGVLTLIECASAYAGGHYGIISEFYVDPSHRSAGIGHRLLEEVRAVGRNRSWGRIEVTAPQDPRWQRTIRFYEKERFIFTGPKLRLSLPRTTR